MNRIAGLAALGALALGLGCASGPAYDMSDSRRQAEARSEEGPLGGEALSQRKQDLQRAFGDLVAFEQTMASLIERADARGTTTFDDFVATYVGTHLDPLLASQWQSDHPEVSALDANLRFAKADLMVQMRYPRRVQRVIDEIEIRYHGRDSMLVEYPMGEQNTLSEALEILKNRKWNG